MSGLFTAQKVIFWGIGGFLLACSAVVTVVWPVVFFSQLEQQLQLKDGSKSYELWKKTPIPLYMDMYMFNWTNPEETLNSRAKPNFVELGPYVFSLLEVKDNLTWNPNDTVTFYQRRTWKFVPEKSNGTLSDEITNVNVIAMLAGNAIKWYVPKEFNWFVNFLMKKKEKTVYVSKTVEQLLFKGYDDPLIDLIKELEPIIKKRYKLPFDKFGWFYQRNNSLTYDGTFNMRTGTKYLSTLGIMEQWNYENTTGSFSGECSAIKGTTGELWPYGTSNLDEITIFITDICSTMTLKSDSNVNIQSIAGKMFKGDEMVFDNGQKDKKNACYCSGTRFKCSALGTRNISKCKFGAPAFISYPHFYLADKSYRENISGMNPVPERHSFTFALDSVASIPMEVHARLQINILGSDVPGINFFKGLPEVYFPMFWFEQRTVISGELASQLKLLTFLDVQLEVIFIALGGLGLVLLVLGLILWARRQNQKHQPSHTPLLDDTQSIHSNTSNN